MNYSEYFQKFYGGRSAGAIIGYKSKEKIPDFIFSISFGEAGYTMAELSGSSFAKYFDGTRNPDGEVWKQIAEKFDELYFSRKLAQQFNTNMLNTVAERFGITVPEGETADKNLLCIAVAKQFHAIARGNGEADEVVPAVYQADVNIDDFPTYTRESLKKYEMMKTLLYSSAERPFDEFYVCNTITKDRYQFRRRQRSGANADGKDLIENVDLPQLLEINRWVLLVGMGGIGKSMMMRHLFLESIRIYHQTGVLPILVTLREFSSETGDLFTLIMKSVNRFDPTFSSVHLHKVLKSGKCQLLLDGLDEVRYSEMEAFQRQLDELNDQYPNTQCVMSTRNFSNFVEISRFRLVWMLPFTQKQSLELIDKLDFCSEEPKLKEEFREKLEKEYLETHRSFVSNPLLLTLMLMNYRRFSDVPEKRYLFYKEAYETLLYRHDADKIAYRRVFRSVNEPSDFTAVFREFCARSYRHGDYEFEPHEFEKYFNELHKKDEVNSKTMNMENFLFDVLHSVCLMYEESQSYHFLHRSFQEYFFADYYHRQNDTTLRRLGKALCKGNENHFDDGYGFEMLFELDSKKTEEFIILPYLTDMFDGKTADEAYKTFLVRGFETLFYTWFDKKNAKEVIEDFTAMDLLPTSINEPANMVMKFILKYNHLDPFFQLDTLSLDVPPKVKPAMSFFMRRMNKEDGPNEYRLARLPYDVIERSPKLLENVFGDSNFERDKTGKPCTFGGEYIIDYSDLFAEPDKNKAVIDILNSESSKVRQMYYTIERYYKSLKEKYTKDPDAEEDDDF